ncbi:hypothetical protein [Vogesella indigofera]|uniref:hypothetical protein n=1 Tax=Vogesella indigofera TaxID=45465 RepID=UPI0035ADC486
MKASKDYLLEALEKVEGKTDGEKAKALKIAGSTLSQYKSGKQQMDDFACIMVARVLGLDPMEIIAACQEEREKSEERREFWKDFRSSLGTKLAAVLTIGATTMMMPTPAQAAALTQMASSELCLLCLINYAESAASSTLPPVFLL